MPINYKKYPANWLIEIRPRILERARNCCEFCGLKNYAVGFRNASDFIKACGNLIQDMAGRGELSYKEALQVAEVNNEENDMYGKCIVIVLTIAHLDHDISNNADSNLKALCQRCHLAYDKDKHKETRNLNKQKLQPILF